MKGVNRRDALVIAAIWPGLKDETLIRRRAALVHDVEMGGPTPTLSRKEQEAIRAEIAKIDAGKP